jgi:3-hydroxyisobutyrate dehydrogenase-like beta-hydroxyacid dehydrogenase
MKSKFDAIVIGLGAMGSAAIYQLAKRGKTVPGSTSFRRPIVMARRTARVVLFATPLAKANSTSL